ncbi:MAG: hypothetical protein ACI9FW_001296 [Flavobacterium sp.]|jgi:hypothetical protein
MKWKKNIKHEQMIKYITKNNETLYDIESIKRILKVPKSKIQRELKNIETKVIKYKNLHLFPERTLFYLMEIILIEKLEKQNDRF